MAYVRENNAGPFGLQCLAGKDVARFKTLDNDLWVDSVWGMTRVVLNQVSSPCSPSGARNAPAYSWRMATTSLASS
jgi:hypothetical protein